MIKIIKNKIDTLDNTRKKSFFEIVTKIDHIIYALILHEHPIAWRNNFCFTNYKET